MSLSEGGQSSGAGSVRVRAGPEPGPGGQSSWKADSSLLAAGGGGMAGGQGREHGQKAAVLQILVFQGKGISLT